MRCRILRTILQQSSWLTGPLCMDPILLLLRNKGRRRDRWSISISRESNGGLWTAMELQCVIDVPWPRRFRAQAIGRNDRGRIPRITGPPVDCHRHCCGTMSIPRVDGVDSCRVARGYAPGLMRGLLGRIARIGASLDGLGTHRGRMLCERIRRRDKIVQEGHAANRAGSAYRPLPINGNLRNLWRSCIIH